MPQCLAGSESLPSWDIGPSADPSQGGSKCGPTRTGSAVPETDVVLWKNMCSGKTVCSEVWTSCKQDEIMTIEVKNLKWVQFGHNISDYMIWSDRSYSCLAGAELWLHGLLPRPAAAGSVRPCQGGLRPLPWQAGGQQWPSNSWRLQCGAGKTLCYPPRPPRAIYSTFTKI